MRFLIVDESSVFRDQLALLLRARWPLAEAEQWGPRQRGNPGAVIAAGGYSAVLLDAHPAGEDGIHWVAQVRRDPAAPPVVLISDQGGEHLAIRAMKAGASDFLRKGELAAERLARALEDALREQEARRSESSGEGAFTRTVRLDLRKIGAPMRGREMWTTAAR